MSHFTIPGLTNEQGAEVAELLQKQLSAYNDLHLTLKHVHWNVVGPSFIGVHTMIDPQVTLVRGYADDVAERIATLGASPKGTPGAIVDDRTWNDYSLGRDTTSAHLAALDLVYTGIIEDTRKNIARIGELDLVTQDLLIRHLTELETFQWFIRHFNGSSAPTSRTPPAPSPTLEPEPKSPLPEARSRLPDWVISAETRRAR